MTGPEEDLAPVAIALLSDNRATVATAESLTGGLLCASLVDVPGASVVVLGGIVAYSAASKTSHLGVPAELMAERGTVDALVAEQMAQGARTEFGASYGLATTGVAGPGPSEGKPAGTVHIAVASAAKVRTESLCLVGGRPQVRIATARATLSLLIATLKEEFR